MWSQSNRHLLNPRILIADSDATSLQRLRRIAAMAAPLARFVSTSSAADTLQHLSDTACHLLIMDLELRDGGGLALLASIAQRHSSTVRVVHSSRLETLGGDLVRRISDRVLEKPASTHDILATVRWALERSAQALARPIPC